MDLACPLESRLATNQNNTNTHKISQPLERWLAKTHHEGQKAQRLVRWGRGVEEGRATVEHQEHIF